MCREFVLNRSWDDVKSHFQVASGNGCAPHFGLRAGRKITAIGTAESGQRTAQTLRWGLVPSWSMEDDAERRIFNARAESLHEKLAFRDSLLERRCIVPASGFFEWTTQDGVRAPLYVSDKNDGLWGFAALWDEWVLPNGHAFRSCAIITTESNRLLSPHHARMPAILRPESYAQWLDPQMRNGNILRNLLQPFSPQKMTARFLSNEQMKRSTSDPQRIESNEIIEYSKEKFEPKKRLVLRDWHSPEGQVFFQTRSFTRDDYTMWHPVVDLENGAVWCDCPDFRFRHSMHEPSLNSPSHWCKHVARAVENCRRHGELSKGDLNRMAA